MATTKQQARVHRREGSGRNTRMRGASVWLALPVEAHGWGGISFHKQGGQLHKK
jgi:hypothetical protein